MAGRNGRQIAATCKKISFADCPSPRSTLIDDVAMTSQFLPLPTFCQSFGRALASCYLPMVAS